VTTATRWMPPSVKHALREAARSMLSFYPLYSGCSRIANLTPFVWLADHGEATARLRTGGRIFIDTGDYDGRAIYFFGEQDPKITWVCKRTLRPGDTALDVGANWGMMTMTLAHFVGKGGTVHAFEPQPRLADAVRRSSVLNGYNWVHVHPIGLSDKDETRDLSFVGDHTGVGSLHGLPAWAKEEGTKISVTLKHADRHLESLGIKKVRLVKMDVEGHEEHVLSGAAKFFDRTPPDVVIFEQNRSASSFWDHPVTRFFVDRKYSLLAIPAHAKLSPRLRPLTRSSNGVMAHDFVAISNGPDHDGLVSALCSK